MPDHPALITESQQWLREHDEALHISDSLHLMDIREAAVRPHLAVEFTSPMLGGAVAPNNDKVPPATPPPAKPVGPWTLAWPVVALSITGACLVIMYFAIAGPAIP